VDAVAKILVVAQAGNVIVAAVELASLREHVGAAGSLSPRLVSTRHHGKKATQYLGETIATYAASRHVVGEILSDHSRSAGEGEDRSDGGLHCDGVVGIFGLFCVMVNDEW
jgi:hypothetical protein